MMSAAESLRGFVTDRLAAAAREILAALQETVSGYEEEASDFRREIEGQRRQLELLRLQLRSAGERISNSDQKQKEKQTGSRVRPDRRRAGRPRSDKHDRMELRLRLLEACQTDVMTNRMLRTCPLQVLQVPRGVPEADFLRLLGSAFPLLTDRRFVILTLDKRRKLQRLQLPVLTAEQIHTHVGGATLYIRPTEEKSSKDSAPEGGASLGEDARHPSSGTELQNGERDAQRDEASDRLRKGRSLSVTDALCCRVCGSTHQSDEALVQHAWSHVGGVCGVCGEATEELQDHLQQQHQADARAAACGDKPTAGLSRGAQLEQRQQQLDTRRKSHLCGVCGKSLSDYRSLSRHKATHSAERPHSCQTCGRSFKLIGTLRQHEKIHAPRERSYLCDVCCKMFLTGKQLQVHMRQHTQEKPFRCGECGRAFAAKWPLVVHTRVHTGETPYRCPECGWSFKRKIHLDNHVSVHSGLKPFVCGVCGKACARKSYLSVHMRTHSGERPYQCAVCQRAFTQSHCLKTHMRSHQQGPPPGQDPAPQTLTASPAPQTLTPDPAPPDSRPRPSDPDPRPRPSDPGPAPQTLTAGSTLQTQAPPLRP